MIDKTTSLPAAIAEIPDGATVMVGGFGRPGTPFCLIDELVRQGTGRLTVIKNDANEPGVGVDRLLEAGLVERLIVSHLGLNPNAITLMNESRVQVELCPQGILAERIRAGGAGLTGIVSDIGVGTVLVEGKQQIELDGRPCVIDTALRADAALIHAHQADSFGNLTYAASARNFNPLMATAAPLVIAEAEKLVPLGGLSPDAIHTPGPFIDRVVAIPELTEPYGVRPR